MLRACVLDFKRSWIDHLMLIRFAYNNIFQSIETHPMRHYMVRNVDRPDCWDDVGEKVITGPKLVQITLEKAPTIRDRFKTAQDRQKSWADSK